MKRQGSTEGDNKPDNCDTENVSMDGFQPIEEDSEDL